MKLTLTHKSRFKAVLTADDKRTGYAKGTQYSFLNGVYWNHRNKTVILMTDIGRIAFPENIVEVTVTS